jgi:DNA-binding PadR family transcriptional regulator
MEIYDLTKRYVTLPFILWFIGCPAKELVWKEKTTGKDIRYKKANDDQATYHEIKHYLTRCAQIKEGTSRSMIHFLLNKMENEWGLIETVEEKEKGKPAIYTLTNLGKEAQHLLALYYDLRIKIGETSGLIGQDKDKDGNPYFIPMIQIKKKEDVEIISKAIRYSNEKQPIDKFIKDITELQRQVILMYCLNVTNSSVSVAINELLGEKGIEKAPKILLEFFKQIQS